MKLLERWQKVIERNGRYLTDLNSFFIKKSIEFYFTLIIRNYILANAIVSVRSY